MRKVFEVKYQNINMFFFNFELKFQYEILIFISLKNIDQ